MAKLDDYRAKYVGEGEGQISEREFRKISSLDAPPHTMVPWSIKIYKWLLSRIGKKHNGIADDKDAMRTLQNIVTEFKENRHLLRQKDFNYYDYPTLISELAEAKLKRLKKELDRIDGAKLVAQSGDKSMYLILTMEAAQKYGAGTRWCISATRTQSMWSSYANSKSNIFFFLIDLEPDVENQEKIAIQVHDIKRKGDGSVSYSLTFWNVLDETVPYNLPNEFDRVISDICSSDDSLKEYKAIKSEKERQANAVKSKAVAAEKLEQTYKNPAMYIMSEMDLPKFWIDKLIPEVRLLFKEKHDFTTLRNMRHGSIISLGGSRQMQSLGDLVSVCDLLDVRGCPNITDFAKLKYLHGINEKGEEQEAEVYYDDETNKQLVARLEEIVAETGKGTLIKI